MKKKDLVYIISVAVGIVLFIIGSKLAYIERGYSAVGGEIFMLFLPLIASVIYDTVKTNIQQMNSKEER